MQCSICVFHKTCTMQMTDHALTLITRRRWRWPLLLGTRAVICVCSLHTEVEAVKETEMLD